MQHHLTHHIGSVCELACLLGIDRSELIDLASRPPYERWRVRKRGGKWRQISAPAPRLKEVQRWILRNITSRLPVHAAAHGCQPGRSIVTHAAPHAGAALIVKADIRDFFPRIHFNRVAGLLWSHGLDCGVGYAIAELCTASIEGPRALPQGAPTSPSIANAICLSLDQDLASLADAFGARYTRYVDDLAFSFASAIDPRRFLGCVDEAVRRKGFELNADKTLIEHADARQTVAGLVTNTRPRPPREMLRRLRAAVHQIDRATPRQQARLRGLIAFVAMSDPTAASRLLLQLEKGTASCTTTKSET